MIDEKNGAIEEILPRKNKISRPTKWGPAKERIIASNVDKIVAVVSAGEPSLRTSVIDRMLIVAERERLEAAVCINKIDLANDIVGDTAELYKNIGYEVFLVSAKTGEGVEEFRKAVSETFSVFLGQSGVGKSSLINLIVPGLNLRVREISGWSGKGKHTTSYVMAVPVGSFGLLADTPGFRDFGLWDVRQEEICYMFREFLPYSDGCKYHPCFHIHEPDCRVKEAYAAGRIAPSRYENYMRIYESYDEEKGLTTWS